MKALEYLPTEFKPDKSTRNTAVGRYLIQHPLVKNYFFEVSVVIEENKFERVSVKLVVLVSRTKSLFRSSVRYLTFQEAQMIKESFFDEEEEVIQYQKEIQSEVMAGDHYSHLFKIHPMANYKEWLIGVSPPIEKKHE